MRLTALLFSLVLILFSFGSAVGQAILIDNVEGLDDPVNGYFTSGATLAFNFKIVGDATNHLMLNNGFEFCSDDMTWDAEMDTLFNPLYAWATWFDFIRQLNDETWVNGSGCDTVGLGLLSLMGGGLPPNFNDIAFTITLKNVTGPNLSTLTVDSCWYPPSNPWMWDVVGENVGWGGPYTYTIFKEEPTEPYTYCTPQPTILKDIDLILYVHIANEVTNEVVLESIRVQSKIPPYDGVAVENGEVITTAFIMRFLGASGFRPVTADFTATYTVEYDKTDGTHPVLTGDFALKINPGDVTFDGQANIDDLIFAAEYFWRDGDVPSVSDKAGERYDVSELLDANQDGYTDPRDVLEIRSLLNL